MSAVLGLMGKKKDNSGVWHRVCLNTIVRKGQLLDSERLRILPMGSKVFVVEQRERRVRIDQPIAGWCSLRSSNGDTILTPLDDSESMPATTPMAADLRTKQNQAKNAADNVENNQHAKIDAMRNQHLDNQKVNEMRQEILRLQEELNEKGTTGLKLNKAQYDLEKTEEEKMALEEENKQNNLHLEELREQLDLAVSQLEQINNTDAQQLMETVKEIQQLEDEKRSLFQEILECERLTMAQKKETENLQKKQTQLFFTTGENDVVSLRPDDVVMLKEDIGLVIIKYVGRVPEKGEGTMIGVELSDPVGNHNGTLGEKEYFVTKPNHGAFYPTTHIKKVIKSEELLNALNKQVLLLQKEITSKE